MGASGETGIIEGRLFPSDGQGDLPIVVRAAFLHPDVRVRERVLSSLDRWIAQRRPIHAREEIERALVAVSGTLIEPFVLSDTRFEVAVRVLQAAFCVGSPVKRVRIVSEETFGAEGGWVMTDNLNGYYAERYPLGANRKGARSGSFVAPAEMERCADNRTMSDFAVASLSTCFVGGTGFVFRIPVPHWLKWIELDTNHDRICRHIRDHSFVGVRIASFAALGLTVEYQPPDLLVHTGSPESLLRVSAHMANGDTMVMSPGEPHREHGVYFIQLRPGEEDVAQYVTVWAVTASSPSLTRWVRLEHTETVDLPDSDRKAISDWAPPHVDWISQGFFEELGRQI